MVRDGFGIDESRERNFDSQLRENLMTFAYNGHLAIYELLSVHCEGNFETQVMFSETPEGELPNVLGRKVVELRYFAPDCFLDWIDLFR